MAGRAGSWLIPSASILIEELFAKSVIDLFQYSYRRADNLSDQKGCYSQDEPRKTHIETDYDPRASSLDDCQIILDSPSSQALVDNDSRDLFEGYEVRTCFQGDEVPSSRWLKGYWERYAFRGPELYTEIW